MENEKNIAKVYNPKNVEERIYEEWLKNKYFDAEVDKNKTPYTIVMPPPNITGQLHMGHALDNTLQDILIRWKRMQGYSALWLPGTDHASIATEARIIKEMADEGITKEQIGREKFLERAWEWKRHYGGRITEQLKKLGCSCDWDRERFTLDEGLSKAVTEVFIKLYHEGLIYRGERITNWCPECGTSISDIEVEYEQKTGKLWHIKYPAKDGQGYVVVATTRPETMLGDVAVAVHPDDERYSSLVGKTVVLPLMNREIPVIADEYVDMEFGTGVVKITPAHDPNDFEVGERHGLDLIKVIDDHANMNENAGKYKGLDRYEAREKIVGDLEQLGLLIKTEEHIHNVGQCYRCDTVIEPITSLQWFVKMEPLATPAIDVVKEGTVKFIPDRFSKTYLHWMENIKDWCISRQLWWGHRIPAYYCTDCKALVVSEERPGKCKECGGLMEQDPDTLDTWFSSALWPFSTLGWPDNTEDMDYFYPTNVLVTAYDIIFFWVARMIFSGLKNTGKQPFDHVFIHGIVRDSEGRKMSKSLGNGIDPLEVIEEYGTDALRFALTIGVSPGNDLRYLPEKVDSSRNFANKIWNASRFVIMNLDLTQNEEATKDFLELPEDMLNTADKWIISRLNTIVEEVTHNMEKYELGIALQKIYEFTWEEFCDWYIELAKPRLYGDDNQEGVMVRRVLNYVLVNIMKLLHPFMPFITEEIYQHLAIEDRSVMISDWPVYNEKHNFELAEKRMLAVMDAIKSIRNIRAEKNVPYSRKTKVIIVSQDTELRNAFEEGKIYFERLAATSDVAIQAEKTGIPVNAISSVIVGAEIYIPLEELVDIKEEIQRLEKERENLKFELDRVNSKLGNEGFIAKAPEKVVDEERQKLVKYTEMMKNVEERLSSLSNI